MIIVTGGAGFIGSALVWALNERGRHDVLVVDTVGHDEQEHNLAALSYEQLVSGTQFREQLAEGYFDDKGVEAILHMGAISSTTETDEQKLKETNVDFSQEIIRWCVDREVRCVYASSGATYGDGSQGYSDDPALFDQLQPLNGYGKSKLAVDIWARDAGYLEKVAGLRYFNVFGPNEYHKEHMRSVVAKKFEQIKETGVIELFRSNDPKYKDGEQMRDFLYVKDAVAATLYFLAVDAGGVFNVGTGHARTWNDVAAAMFAALDIEARIEYIDLPAELKDQYQNFTQADIGRLRAAGFTHDMMAVEAAVTEYIQNYLLEHRHLGEEVA